MLIVMDFWYNKLAGIMISSWTCRFIFDVLDVLCSRAAHPMCSCPLLPGVSRRGSVAFCINNVLRRFTFLFLVDGELDGLAAVDVLSVDDVLGVLPADDLSIRFLSLS